MKTPRAWFLPATEDLLGLLFAQWSTTRISLDDVRSWADGAMSMADATRALIAAIDREREQQRALHKRVRSAFSTPLDAEDIYELGERISKLHRQLYLLLREADLGGTAPDDGLRSMLMQVVNACDLLDTAISALPLPAASDAADEATDCLEGADGAYRAAVRETRNNDLRVELQQREMYRRAEQVVDAALAIAHRTWYAVSKVS